MRKILWNIYAWPVTLLIVTSYFWGEWILTWPKFLFFATTYFRTNLTPWWLLIIDFLMTLPALIALHLHIREQRLFNRLFWIIYAFVFVFWQFLYNLFIEPTYTEWPAGPYMLIGVLIMIPLYVALFRYPFVTMKDLTEAEQSPRQYSIKKKVYIAITSVIILVIGFCPFPVAELDDDLKEKVVSYALSALIENNMVFTDRGFFRLADTNIFREKDRLYFENQIGVPDSIFAEHKLKPVPKDRKLDVDSGDVIISFSFSDSDRDGIDSIHFYYHFGSLGAQGYEIRIYKSLLINYFVYVHHGSV